MHCHRNPGIPADRLLPSFSDIYFRKIEVCVIVVPMSAIEMGNAR